MATLTDVFAPARVIDLAGRGAYLRGAAYAREGRTVLEDESDATLRATVRGSVPYTVELRVGEGAPQWSCTCPAAEDGSFCKHCVAAVSLRNGHDADWLDEEWDEEDTHQPDEGELAEYVADLDRDRLEGLALEAAASDWRLRERLLAETRAARGEGLNLGTWRRRIDTAFAPSDDFVPYREVAGWAAEVDEVIDALQELCDAGHPDAVVVLAEHAYRCADEAIQYVDDSDGWLTDISQDWVSCICARAPRARKTPPGWRAGSSI